MSFLEIYREAIVNDLFHVPTFDKCWIEKWNKHPAIEKFFETPDFEKLESLGSSLREIFLLTNEKGRDQGSLSGGGVAWECLITWYINLGLVGTRTVVFKHKKKFYRL